MRFRTRCVIVATAFLLATCASPDPNTRAPLSMTSKTQTSASDGIVIVGISTRNPKFDSILHLSTKPIWMGWIQYDPATQRRIGKTMVIAAEDCNKMDFSLASGLLRVSDACDGLQYRAYALAPGSYALAWSYHSHTPHWFARFRTAKITYSANNSWLAKYEFSEEAIVPKEAPTFSVGPGEVVYVGTYTLDFANSDAGALSITPGDIAAARKYVEPMGLADKLISRPMARVTVDPAPPEQVSGGAL